MRKRAVLLLMLLLVTFSGHAGADSMLYVTYCSAGDGEAVLLRCDGEAMLIDTGSSAAGDGLLLDLISLGITELSHIAITLPDAAHIGGLSRLAQVFDIGTVWLVDSPFAKTSSCYQAAQSQMTRRGLSFTAPASGETFTIGSATVTVLSPMRSAYTAIGDYSLVLRVDHGDLQFLFAGEIAADATRDLLEAPEALRADVLKPPTQMEAAFLHAVMPDHILTPELLADAPNGIVTYASDGAQVYRLGVSAAVLE